MQLPARLGGSTIRLPHSLFAAVILAASLSMLLLAPSWMGASRQATALLQIGVVAELV